MRKGAEIAGDPGTGEAVLGDPSAPGCEWKGEDTGKRGDTEGNGEKREWGRETGSGCCEKSWEECERTWRRDKGKSGLGEQRGVLREFWESGIGCDRTWGVVGGGGMSCGKDVGF